MVWTSELLVVVSADTTDLVCFPLLFFTSATCAAVREVGIFPAVYRVRCGAMTLDGPLRDAAGASLSIPPSSRRRTHRQEEVALPARPTLRTL
jgi:hypothetical protein